MGKRISEPGQTIFSTGQAIKLQPGGTCHEAAKLALFASTLILDNTVLERTRKDQSPARAPSTPSP
jgi:hypothetical protein